jgi:hypothetical protein
VLLTTLSQTVTVTNFMRQMGTLNGELLAADDRCMVSGHNAVARAVAVGLQPTSDLREKMY